MHFIYIILFLLAANIAIIGQTTIFGVVSGEQPLSNVNITIPELNSSTISDENGSYILKNIPEGNYNIKFSYVGYKNQDLEIEIEKDSSFELNVKLEEKLIKLGEAVVISSKSDYLLKDLPIPLELVDNAKLNSASEISISDVMKKESGISVIKDGPWATSVNVRGLSNQNLVYLIDGNRIETSTNIAAGLSLMDMNDFESVEIVKGGLSSLYGTGATGGVINIQSKTASFQNMPYLSSQVISGYNSVNNGYSNYVNLKSGGKNWSLKLNGSLRKADDMEVPDGKLDNSAFKDESLAASLKYSPLEDMIVNLDFQKFSAYDVGIPGGAPFPQPAIATYKYSIRELYSPSIEYNNISKYLVKTKLKYYHQVIKRSVELKPNPMVTANPKADHITNGLSFQSDWYLSKSNLLTVGVDYWQRE
ncbi:MAG: TonB-dependent receptor, partial [Melioribacteraceae bacterium]|nr:TonB-dependent receptor [Melioribacteraceae bacterium]